MSWSSTQSTVASIAIVIISARTGERVPLDELVGRFKRELGPQMIKSEDAFLGLLLATGDEDPAIRALAVRKLGDTGLERFISTVRVILSDPDVLVRVSACKSMGSIGTLDEVPDLVQLLGDPDGHVVVSAIEALGSSGGHDARDAVMSMVRSSDIEFRRTSLKALEGFQGVEDVLVDGAKRARTIGVPVLEQARQAAGVGAGLGQ